MTDVTCALLVLTPTNQVLLGHPTNAGYYGCWSLPKGIKEAAESEAQAAARECFEETGFDVRDKISEFQDLGRHSYVKGKDLYLFLYRHDAEIKDFLFECTTHFQDRKGNPVVEIDRHLVASPGDAMKLLNQKQAKIIIQKLPNFLSMDSHIEESHVSST